MKDDLTCADFIDYLPILAEPHSETPIPPLVVNFTYTPITPYAHWEITFDASASFGQYSTITHYTWNFGNGNNITLNIPIASHVYTTPGSYNVTLTVTDKFGFRNSTSTSVLVLQDETPPVINIISPENRTYVLDSVSLTFNINEPTSWICYSLDGHTNVTIDGNTTLTGFFDGLHRVVVYANDSANNTGSSSIIHFTVMAPPNITGVSQLPTEDNVLTEDQIEVNATVTDLSGVKHVTLNYTLNNGTWFIVNMTNLEENVWNATVPAFSYCTYVNYFISAEDNVGNVITSEEILGYQYGYHVIPREPTLLVDGVINDWSDLDILPLGTDPDDGWAGYADLRKFWAHMADTNLYLAIQVDWEYPVDSEPVIFTILITPENSSSWYEVIWYNASRTVLLGHGEHHGWEVPLISETGWDGILEFSVPLFLIGNPQVVSLEVDSYSSDWVWNIDLMPAPWEDPYTIPEFPSFLILPLFMIATLLIVIVYRRKRVLA